MIQVDQAPWEMLGLLPSEAVSQVHEMLLGLLPQQAGWRKEQRPLGRTLCGAGKGSCIQKGPPRTTRQVASTYKQK